MVRVEVRLNLEVPPNSQFYEIRQLIGFHFGTVRWLDSREDDDRVSNDCRPLIASVSKIRYELACQFIKHETLPDGSVFKPFVRTEKAWRVRNTGIRDWPPGTCLRQCWGELGMCDAAFVPLLKVNEEGVIRIPLHLPAREERYEVHFQLYHPDCGYFGQKLWFSLIISTCSFTQEATQEASQEATQKATQEATREVTQKATQEATQKATQWVQVGVLDERNVKLPACFKLGTTPPSPAVHTQRDACQWDDALGGGTQSRECQGPSMVS
ncbi:hypothetical protein BIW11_12791, partial [Tropilaelaps mercedesae]